MNRPAAADHFVYLEQDSRLERADQLITRGSGVQVPGGEVLLALDLEQRRHLLIPLGDDDGYEDRRSKGVQVHVRQLGGAGSEEDYLDLVCMDGALALVFERLIDDVLARLSEERDGSPAQVAGVVLAEWRALLQATQTGLGREAAVGLIGELEVLRRLVATDPLEAIRSWIGPRKALHDFVRESRALEVKATASRDGKFVSIANLDQLDPGDLNELHLVLVHLRPDPTAPSIDDRVRALIELGCPERQVIDLLAEVGHIYEADHNEEHRYAIRGVRAWLVSSDFPGLRRSTLPEASLRGVSGVTYELAVDSAPPPLPEAETDRLLSDWLLQ